MAFQDTTLTCVECGKPFTFTADEQQFHAEKGYTNQPKRCPTCRESRRMERRSTGGGSRFGGGMERQMYTATCAQCGQPAEVPFRPRGDRPVYCSSCYNQQRSRSDVRSFR
jgi:CxxC-x17-CxxC domain-containing protein